jgi:hypothetical protein
MIAEVIPEFATFQGEENGALAGTNIRLGAIIVRREITPDDAATEQADVL